MCGQLRRLTREIDEHLLRDIRGEVRITIHHPARRAVDKIEVAPRQLGECALAFFVNKLPEQVLVVHGVGCTL